MKTKVLALLALLALSLLGGCAIGHGRDSFTQGELADLAQGCDALLDTASPEDDILVGRVDGTTSYIVETPDGRCLSEGDALLDALYEHDLVGVASDVSADILAARKVESEPVPHPDVNHHDSVGRPNLDGSLSADPMPHPDRGRPENEDEVGEVVVIWVVIERGE